MLPAQQLLHRPGATGGGELGTGGIEKLGVGENFEGGLGEPHGGIGSS